MITNGTIPASANSTTAMATPSSRSEEPRRRGAKDEGVAVGVSWQVGRNRPTRKRADVNYWNPGLMLPLTSVIVPLPSMASAIELPTRVAVAAKLLPSKAPLKA